MTSRDYDVTILKVVKCGK